MPTKCRTKESNTYSLSLLIVLEKVRVRETDDTVQYTSSAGREAASDGRE